MTSTGAVGIVAGSGIALDALLDERFEEHGFSDIPELKSTGVGGHSGKFVRGRCGRVEVVLQTGRLHFYEGLEYAAVTRTVDAMRSFGVATVVFTNAAGGLDERMTPGDLMSATDLRLWPFGDWNARPERVVPDFVVEGAQFRGRYLWMHGPCYETRAEIAALRSLGGDAVGMSTAPEMVRCHELGMRAGAVSCITNNCCVPEVLTHAHVVETAHRASAELVALIREALPGLAAIEA